MLNLSNENPNNRVIFPKGKQTLFIEKIKYMLDLTWTDLAILLNINARLLQYYRNEKYTLPIKIFKHMLGLSKCPQPVEIKIVRQYSFNVTSGTKGGLAVYKKYGSVGGSKLYRTQMWKNWWKKYGKNNPNVILRKKPIKTPKFSEELAELCGILIGDGGITEYQMTITLNGETDREYSKFIEKLLIHLFDIKPKIYKIKNSKAINLSISRKALVEFFNSCGLKTGNKLKQKLSIPRWIIENQNFQSKCLRGLIDTDGSIVHEKHKINGVQYSYPRLNFTSASPKLIKQVFNIFRNFNFNPKKRRSGRSIQLENIKEICDYFNTIGSSNPKHHKRIESWK